MNLKVAGGQDKTLFKTIKKSIIGEKLSFVQVQDSLLKTSFYRGKSVITILPTLLRSVPDLTAEAN